MKQKLIRLTRRYAWALKKYLMQGRRGTLGPARGLGLQAVKLGLEASEMVRIHKEALAALKSSSGQDGITKRAEIFFTEAIIPIEQAPQADPCLSQVNKSLDQRTIDLAASNRSLEKDIVRRKIMAKAFRKSSGRSQRLLKESHRLQKYLRDTVHRIISAQEDKRKQISHELQDEIAQILLGINVRLLRLKKNAAVGDKGLKKDIASTQRLVKESIQSINRYARDLSLAGNGETVSPSRHDGAVVR